MTCLRVLHVDDEPDIREIVEMSLLLDPKLQVQGCASGADALKAAVVSPPDLILLDVMMPGMDGPTMLAHLRANPTTAKVPVVFMTARAQTQELEHFRSLGAAGVIAKPFDPMTLAATVRGYLHAGRLASLCDDFILRARKDAETLAYCRRYMATHGNLPDRLGDVRTLAHGLAGAAGIYGFDAVSTAAASLEHEVIEEFAGKSSPGQLHHRIDALLALLAPFRDVQSGPDSP